MASGRQTTFKDIDLSRTVGRFAYGILEVLDLGTTSQPKEALSAIAKHHHVITDYSLTTMMGVFSDKQEEHWDYFNPQVIFNYMSRQPKSQSPNTQIEYEPTITVTGDCIPMPRLLKCTAKLIQGEPHIIWEYNCYQYWIYYQGNENEKTDILITLLDLIGMPTDLAKLIWEYNKNIYKYDTIKNLSQVFMEELQLLINKCVLGN